VAHAGSGLKGTQGEGEKEGDPREGDLNKEKEEKEYES
jgi:hypothetical protein